MRPFAYLQHLGAGHQNDANLRTYVDNAPSVLRFFCDEVGVPFYAVPNFPDYYHGMAPGSRGHGRNLQVKPFEAASLGEDRKRLRVAPAVTHRATFEEIAAWGGRAKPQGWDRDLIRQRIDQDIRTFGAGLIGHLIHAALQRGIPMHTDTPIDHLVVEDGRVTGVVARQNGDDLRIRARNAVVLATGSYNRNAALTARFNEIHSGKSVLPPTIEGDGLTVAGEIGAAIKFTPMFQQDLVYAIPGETHDGGPLYRGATNNESGFPHSILVNLDGNRFADESIGQEVGVALRNFDTRRHCYPNVPCFLVFDQTYMNKYGLGSILPGSEAPRLAHPQRHHRGVGRCPWRKLGRTRQHRPTVQRLCSFRERRGLRPWRIPLRQLSKRRPHQHAQPQYGPPRATPLLRPAPDPHRHQLSRRDDQRKRPSPPPEGLSHPRPVRLRQHRRPLLWHRLPSRL